MLRALLIGAGTGYATKLVQVACTVLLLPFLLSDSQLGLKTFGQFSALQAIIAILALVFDGWRQSTGKTTGNRVAAGGVSVRDLGVMVGWSFAGVTLLAMLAVVSRPLILSAGNLAAVDGIEVVLFLLLTQLVVEQALFPAEALLHATGNTWKLNLVLAVEVIGRTAAIFVWFLAGSASITGYAGVILVGAVIRMLSLALLACGAVVPRSEVERPTGFQTEVAVIRYSLVLMGSSIANYLVFRAPVVLAARLVSAEAAAILAVLLNSVPNYLRQLTLAVLRPMIIPLGARVNFSTLSTPQQAKLNALLSTHQVAACIACTVIGATGWVWLDLWLGPDFAIYAPPMNALVVAIGLQIASAFQSQLLVAQGWGRPLAAASVTLAAVTFTAMALAAPYGPAVLLVMVAAHCVVLNGLVVKTLFLRMTASKGGGEGSRAGMVALVIGCVGAVGIGYLMPLADGGDGLWPKIAVTLAEIILVTLVCLRYVASRAVRRDAWRAISGVALRRPNHLPNSRG